MIKAGVLGLGNMGKLHFLNALHMKDVEIVAVSDRRKQNLNVARPYHIEGYTDYRDLLQKEDLDAVIISLPNFLKEESVTLASEKNVPAIFIDKPLARTPTEARKIIQSVQHHDSQLMVGTNYRYIDSVQQVNNLINSGRFGDIVISTAELIMDGPFSHPLVPKPVPEWWFSRERAGGGVLLDLGYHLIDIFQWMFGELNILYSTLQHRFNLSLEDSATVILKSKKTSTIIVMNLGWFSRTLFPNFNFRINFHGTVGYTSTDQFAPKSLYRHALKQSVVNFSRKITGKPINRLSYTYYYSSFTKILEIFFNSIKEASPFPITLEEQLNILQLIEDIYTKSRVNTNG